MTVRSISLISAAAIAMALPAAAAGVQTSKVTYTTADLATPAGAEQVYDSLKSSAESVCETATLRPVNLRALIQSKACIDTALDRAVEDVNHPQLTALHASENS